jgi:hypothetical protein
MSEEYDSVESGCNWGCGAVIGVLIALSMFGSFARDITYDIEHGRQEAITNGERLEMQREAMKLYGEK